MRHALGLRGDSSARSSTSVSQPQIHRFVRDGEVPVTVLRQDRQPDGEHGANQLDAVRTFIVSRNRTSASWWPSSAGAGMPSTRKWSRSQEGRERQRS
jgi:hypothetical protein